ncbi:hypothetical protein I3F58_19500 [Streptomyces sp. MUM 203J]|nr:hypothetical protein [Streptomyces sp. MUM 203J]MCH0541711.1 hypothetical protein [Streptomyces sp. MUM 203J]
MHTELREAAAELGLLLWREHTLYRERGGGVVIRGEHVARWISLAPRGTRDEILVRAGRILDGGTTAPARAETVVSLSVSRAELAAVCRRLLADTAHGSEPHRSGAASGPRAGAKGRTRGERRSAKAAARDERRAARERRKAVRAARSPHTSPSSWLILIAIASAVLGGLYVYLVA